MQSNHSIIGGGTSNRDWWPNQLRLDLLHQHSSKSNPMGERFDYAKEFQSLDFAALKKDLAALMTDVTGLVAGGLRSLRPVVRPHGVAQRGNVSRRRRPRRWWPRPATFRAAQQLAGQRQPRQGAPPALADQAEVRPQDLVGRPLHPHRQRRPRDDGLQDVRLRRRSRGRVGAGSRCVLGRARRRGSATQRYSGKRDLENPLAAVQMGLIYVNPEGPNGNPDPIAAAKDIRETFARMAMNDEETVALIAGGHTFGKTHGAGPASHVGVAPEAADVEAQGLGWASTFGTGKGGDAITSGLEVTWTTTPTKWNTRFLQAPLRLRVGADEEPCRRAPVEAEGQRGRGHGSACARRVETHRAFDADHRSLASVRSGVREDLSTLHRASSRARRRVRSRVVQAHPPRHGPARALPRPRGSGRRAHLARPDPQSRSRVDRRQRHRVAQSEAPRRGLVGVAARRDRVGVGFDVPRLRQTRRCQRRPHSSRTAERLARQSARAARASADDPRGHPARVQRRDDGWQEGLARRSDRARRFGRHRTGGEERRSRGDSSVHARAHGCFATANGRRVLRRVGAGRGRVPQLPENASMPSRPKRFWSTRRSS